MERLCLRILRTEVSRMRQDAVWQAFAQTGNPLYYLLYCAAVRQNETEKDGEQSCSQAAAVRR